jgi:hypothetical protein
MTAPPSLGAVAAVGSLGCTVAGASVVFVPLEPTGAVVSAAPLVGGAAVTAGACVLDEPLSLLHPVANSSAPATTRLPNFRTDLIMFRPLSR